MIITVKDDEFIGQGEVAPSIRFEEDEQKIIDLFEKFQQDLPREIQSLEELLEYLDNHGIRGALRFGIESAFIHYLSKLSLQSVEELLGVTQVSSAKTMFSMPIVEQKDIVQFFNDFRVERFSLLKVKCNKATTLDYLKEIRDHFTGGLILDFNESYTDVDSFLQFCAEIEHLNIMYIEQPLPAEQFDDYLELKQRRVIPIFADESLTDHQITEFFSERFDGINIKLQKAGGYIRAIKQMKDAEQMGLIPMLGCRIESTLGISSAIHISSLAKFIDLDGALFIENDPFQMLFEQNGRWTLSSLH
jgi:glutamate racemase